MRSKLFIPLLMVTLFAICQNPLQKSTNLIRGNDLIIKQQVAYKSPGRSGENILWNFSQLNSINDSYKVSYQAYDDSTFVSREHRTLYHYSYKNDSLLLNGYENPTIKMQYSMPELQMVYPFAYGMSFRHSFCGEGSYSQKYQLTSEGVNETIADGTGMMVLPSNDTLYNVIRIHSIKKFTEQKRDITSTKGQSTNALTNSNVISNAPNKDSILFQVDTYQWFADGYRYPIFEIIESTVYKAGRKQNYFKTAFFYSPYVHEYLNNDPENLAVLSGKEEQLETDTLFVLNQLKEKPHYENREAIANSLLKYNYYPSVVEGNLNLELYVPYESDINITLYDAQGKVHEQQIYRSDQNSFTTETFNLSGYPQGFYFLQLKTNKESITEKIIKK